jgi:hypothetical protein
MDENEKIRQQVYLIVGAMPFILYSYLLFVNPYSKFMWVQFGQVIICYFSSHCLFYGLGLFAKRKQKIANEQDIDDKSTGGKREQQHQIIIAVINALNYEPLEIPTGIKSKIKDICLKSPRMFTDSSFDHAWKSGTSSGLFKMLESDRFSSK